MIRFHFTFNKDKMADWLNEMDAHGWQLRNMTAGFCSFDPVRAGTYDYQVDYVGPGSLDPGYTSLMQDLGIDIVCRWGPWVILRRDAADGPFVLYTDARSRLEQLGRVRRFFKVMCCLELLCVIWLLAITVAERSWILMVFGAIGLAAAIGMIVRVRQINVEMAALGAPVSMLANDRTGTILIGCGCFLMAAGLLIPPASWGYLGSVIKGIGIALELIGILRIFWSRRQA